MGITVGAAGVLGGLLVVGVAWGAANAQLAEEDSALAAGLRVAAAAQYQVAGQGYPAVTT